MNERFSRGIKQGFSDTEAAVILSDKNPRYTKRSRERSGTDYVSECIGEVGVGYVLAEHAMVDKYKVGISYVVSVYHFKSRLYVLCNDTAYNPLFR